MDPSTAPRLAHAVALAEAGEPQAALQRLQALLGSVPKVLLPHVLAAMARSHERLGDVEQALQLLRQAADAAPHEADARALRRRADALSCARAGPGR
jgi:predicted RNA polymerase sigma factor